MKIDVKFSENDRKLVAEFGTGEKRRIEVTSEVKEAVVGTYAYVNLLPGDEFADVRAFLAKNRTLDTLFIRVESDLTTPVAYTVVKTWAANNVHTVPTADLQRIHRWNGSEGYDTAGNNETLYSTIVNGKVGLVNIADNGELRWYSGSNGNYYLRPCKVKITIEW